MIAIVNSLPLVRMNGRSNLRTGLSSFRFVSGGSPTEQGSKRSNDCYTLEWKPDVNLSKRVEEPEQRKYALLRRYLDLQTFKEPKLNIAHLAGEQDAELGEVLKEIFVEPSAGGLPCANFISKSVDAGIQESQPSAYHVAILSSSSQSSPFCLI